MDGILVIDKPQGITSHDCVKKIRKIFGVKKVGHAGTLDPLATGILVVLLGKATRKFLDFSGFDKEYEATLTLGITTDTGDIQGKIIKTLPFDHVRRENVLQAFNNFVGVIEQIPPMVSALKYHGEKLYQLARRGIVVERRPRKICIHSLTLTEYVPPELNFKVKCSKGTYIRTLAEDIGTMLGCGGCISSIRRIGLGPFKIEEAIKLEEINASHLRHQ
ncbi:MAG: tRNA pseudouridine(55) synthase TruB [Candidatus Omnitrophota bacterium]|nr:tRNA pseudouridine(55) synthase TruB [Candidatus Omnitrophota bacterium]